MNSFAHLSQHLSYKSNDEQTDRYPKVSRKKIPAQRILSFSFAILLCLSIWSPLGNAQVPTTISIQGMLMNANSTFVNGNHALTFQLYLSPSGGNSIWSETQNSVEVKDGVFSSALGSVNPLTSLSFSSAYWIGISVDGTAEMTPRIALSSAPYSLNARAVIGTTNVFPESGNVGIGKKNPAHPLDVAGVISTDGFHMLKGAQNGYVLTSDAGGFGSWRKNSAMIGLIVESVVASRSTNTVSLEVYNPGNSDVRIERVAIQTTTNRSFLTDIDYSLANVVTDVVTEDIKASGPPVPSPIPTCTIPDVVTDVLTENNQYSVAGPPAPASTIPTWDIPDNYIRGLTHTFGKCDHRDCDGCIINLTTDIGSMAGLRGAVKWLQDLAHQHSTVTINTQKITEVKRDDNACLKSILNILQKDSHLHDIVTPDRIKKIFKELMVYDVWGYEESICYVVEAIYAARVDIPAGGKGTITVNVSENPLHGCPINLQAHEYVRVSSYSARGMGMAYAFTVVE